MIVKRKLFSDKRESNTGEKAGKVLLGVGAGLGAYAGGHLVRSYHQGNKAGLVNEAGSATSFLKDMRKASKADGVSFKNLYMAKKQTNKIMDPVLRSNTKNTLNSIESMKFARGAGKAALATAGIGGALYLGNKLLKKKNDNNATPKHQY